MPRTARAIGAFALSFTLFLPAVAGAQTGNHQTGNQSLQFDNRLRQIENQIQTLSRYVYRGEGQPPATQPLSPTPSPQVTAALQVQVSRLETEMRALTGSIERQQFQLRQIEQRLDRLVGDIDFRLREIEARLDDGGVAPAAATDAADAPASADAPGQTAQVFAAPAPSGQANAPTGTGQAGTGQAGTGQAGARQTGTGQPAAGQQGTLGFLPRDGAPPAGTDTAVVGTSAPAQGDVPPDQIYNRAFNLLRDGNYDQAAILLEEIVTVHGDHPLAPNAQYWLAETHYVQGDMEAAAVAFATGFEKYPDAPKAPDSLLKLGMSLAGMGRTEDACVTLGELGTRFPDAQANLLQIARNQQQRLRCR